MPREQVILPEMDHILEIVALKKLALEQAETPMMSRTHGPTRLHRPLWGKRISQCGQTVWN